MSKFNENKLDLDRLAALCRLTLKDGEAERAAAELKKMADYTYPHLACGAVALPFSLSHTLATLREDEPDESLDKTTVDDIIACAPDTEGGYIRVPRVIDNGGEKK